MKLEQVLDLKVNSYDLNEQLTLREYFHKLLHTLWAEGESFSGKRPFGNSGWEYCIYETLVGAKVVEGTLDEEGCLDTCDTKEADKVVFQLIDVALGVYK